MVDKNCRYYISYDDLESIERFPKSRKEFIKSLFKNFANNFKTGQLILAALLMVFVSLGIIYFLAVIINSMYLTTNTPKSILNYLWPYVFPGIIESQNAYKGFQHWKYDASNLYVIIPLYFLTMMFIKKFIGGVFKKGSIKLFFSNIKNIKKQTQNYKEISPASEKILITALIISFILGFFIFNPLTCLILSIIMFFSYAKNTRSDLIMTVAMFKVSGNLKNGKRKFVNIGKIALFVRGLSIGFFCYFILSALIWFILDYHLYARIVFSAIFIVFFIVLNFVKKQNVRSLAIFFGIVFLFIGGNVFAHDGGWAESGGNFFAWISNAGSKIIGLLGISGALGAALGAAGNLVTAGLFTYLNVDAVVAMGNLLAGFGKPAGSEAANLTFAQAAIKTAFANISPLGDTLSDAVSGIHGALNGDVGSAADVSGNESSSSGTEGGAEGYYDTPYGGKDIKDPFDDKKKL